MLFADLVAASEAIAATRSRSEKIALLADLFGGLEPAEIRPAVAMVAGEPRQGRIGVGWATLAGVSVGIGHRTGPTLSITEVDDALEALAGVSGPGSQGIRAELLGEMLGSMTAAEADFLRRLLIGEVRHGALSGLVAEAVASAAGVPPTSVRRALMLSGQLTTTAAAALEGGAVALAAVGLEVLRPVQPMLASTAGDVDAALADAGRASVEWKLDGARVQAHRSGDVVRIFTRNLNDVTHRLPEVVAEVLGFDVTSLVLDGEVLGQDEATDRPRAFQETISSFAREDGPPARGLVAWWFDVLHLDGRDLVDEPLGARLGLLAGFAGGRVVPSTLTDDPSVARRVLDDALAAGHEGVMVKAATSTYQAGRRGKAWRKVKPVATLDLVVLAAEWGHGRRQGWLSNLHLGARDPATGEPVMVGKTFKGLTDDLLEWQTAAFLEREVGRRGHVVDVRPELVVEVALDGAQASSRYPGGVALRFARVRRYRADKDPGEADTLDAVRSLLPGGMQDRGAPPADGR